MKLICTTRSASCLTLMLACAIVTIISVAAAPPADQSVTVFKDVTVEFDKTLAEGTVRNGVTFLKSGQVIETTIDLPKPALDQRDARRIVATVTVKPVMTGTSEKGRPGDPWTRVGSVRVLRKSAEKPSPPAASQPDTGNKPTGAASQPALPPASTEPEVPNAADEIELMRFITPFGGDATYTQDLTSLAPLLGGKRTIRIYLSSYKKPAWTVSLKLEYTATAVGYRRPMWASPLFFNEMVEAQHDSLRTTVEVPWGLDRPRLRILSTGHASDGTGGDEFISRSHLLKIDGKEVARWRPWVEEGGVLRANNPWSGRGVFDGRERWSSDLDRSGWRPGQVVYPFQIPVPELTPGRHVIELKVDGIRPKDQQGFGYWRISAIAVADEPWPQEDAPGR